MAWLSVVIAVIACVLLYGTGHPILLGVAIFSVVIGVCSWGIMHNFAQKIARNRSNYTGEFYDITENEAEDVPDWITFINMVVSFLGLVMLIIGIVIRFF